MYHLLPIKNTNQTPPYNRTVNSKGRKIIYARTTGHDEFHITFMLRCTADGENWPLEEISTKIHIFEDAYISVYTLKMNQLKKRL